LVSSASGRIVILASTRMMNGVCVAGVDVEGHWVRPVKLPDFDFSAQQLSQAGRVVVEPYNEVEFRLGQRLNNSPQSEDVEAVAVAPILIRTLNERELLALMQQKDEYQGVADNGNDLESWLVGMNRSLVLTRVDEVLRAYRNTYSDGRRQRRIVFRVHDKFLNLPCTDLRWRRLTRDDRDAEALSILKSSKSIYFALGLPRVFREHYYPMVVGVHPLPKLMGDVDYADL
jgi:hypothetical protein